MKMSILALICLICCFSSLKADNKSELKERVAYFLPSIHGWCSKEKAMSFMDLVFETKPKLCVEVGVYGGSSIFPVATALKLLGEGVVVGVDPWDKLECLKYFDPVEDAKDLEWWGKINLSFIYTSYITMLKRFELEECCITMKTTSEKAALVLDNIDILYLDGNHAEVVMEKDAKLYLPKVRSGGYIWINDSLWKQTQKAIDILSEQCDVIKLIDNGNCILFRKR